MGFTTLGLSCICEIRQFVETLDKCIGSDPWIGCISEKPKLVFFLLNLDFFVAKFRLCGKSQGMVRECQNLILEVFFLAHEANPL